ncbi:MAG TPA: hypothetical protein VET26_09570 [Candidatus Sulfotelmatobacter sp.]|nr:hypothetical protein [Candidatus Sulfotelmatobacter sp.]
MSTNIVCPSGLAGEIRGLKGKEGKLLSDRVAARAGSTFEKILAGCWLSTTDAAIYDVPERGALDWSKVLVADRFYALLQIRALTFGDEYAFSVQCQSASCRERFEWTLNLKDLPVRPLSDAAKAAIKAGNRFEIRLPHDGRKVWFRLMTGADEVRAASVLRAAKDGMLLTALALRIVEIEGVPDTDKRKFLDEMEMADAAALLDQFDEADGGVETSIEVECPSCMGVQEVQLPFERGFFLPRSKGRTDG